MAGNFTEREMFLMAAAFKEGAMVHNSWASPPHEREHLIETKFDLWLDAEVCVKYITKRDNLLSEAPE